MKREGVKLCAVLVDEAVRWYNEGKEVRMMGRKLLQGLLMVVYAVLALFGFLSGMLGEGLIGSTHPMADMLAAAMMWLGLAISLSAVVCPVVATRLKEKPVLRGVVLTIPFLLLAVQLVLNGVAERL